MIFALTYPISVRSLPLKGIKVHVSANKEECASLAQNHNLLGVKLCEGKFHISLWKKRGVLVTGSLRVSIIQQCVVTLEALENDIHENIEVIFVPEDSKLAKPLVSKDTGELFLNVDGPDIPDVFYGDKIDIGAVMEEFLELSIDHYPRKENVSINATKNSEKVEEKSSPFSVLKRLK
ncbi:YceD family protein [Bartonella ancashensis]|uniref:DUF177 domain-containing protein n=1 Tax=Bartonella ancashensis TaxID=1318743 RepID=A0A0M4M430_9HYPH|nr:DUF177 domain-containing protein [Bartonella ancashensis]ALE03849.1 Conserved hypothetical protein encoded in Ubiquinol-cytochrome C chaperone locus [Bartonella ancashensis]